MNLPNRMNLLSKKRNQLVKGKKEKLRTVGKLNKKNRVRDNSRHCLNLRKQTTRCERRKQIGDTLSFNAYRQI
jgi:hypothetical protein